MEFALCWTATSRRSTAFDFRFNEAVKRNKKRFPVYFMFQLTAKENASLRSQFAILETGRGGTENTARMPSRNTALSGREHSE